MHARRTVILSAHLGLQGPSMLSHSAMGGSFLGKQLQRGSLIRSQPKMVGSSLYLRPARTPTVSPLAFFWVSSGHPDAEKLITKPRMLCG